MAISSRGTSLRGEYCDTETVLKERLDLCGDAQDAGVQVTSEPLLACSLFH